MKYIYILASGAAKKMKSEQALWDALCAAGLPVRDIHDLPRIAQHDIAVAEPAIARLIKRRMNGSEKAVKLICLVPSDAVLTERMAGLSQTLVNRAIAEVGAFALEDADYCVPADELDVAAKTVANIIADLEADA